MLESRIVRYCLYGSAVIVVSEIAYHSYFWIRNLIGKVSASKEICEVIWTNELTQSCVSQHRRFSTNPSGSGSASGSPTMSDLNRIVKLPSPVKSQDCANPFCAAYNVGKCSTTKMHIMEHSFEVIFLYFFVKKRSMCILFFFFGEKSNMYKKCKKNCTRF